VTIGHDASTLTIDATAYLIQGRTNGVQSSMSSTAYPVRTTYVLDGLEHPSSVVMRSVVPDYPGREFPMPVPGMASSYDQGSFRATWIGSQLVVMKYEKHTVTGPNRTPVAIRRTTREAFALSPDGNLVWETLTLSDPIPGSSEAPTPTPFRRVFRRS
jgi:hypothetical protein